MRFDGKAFAKEIEPTLRQRLRSGVRAPRIVSFLVGENQASELYTRLKKDAAERVGVEFVIMRIGVDDLAKQIIELGERKEITGVMVQMPIPGLSREKQNEIVKAIPLTKDVDGLRWEESQVMPATVRAVLSILERLSSDHSLTQGSELWGKRFVIVGTHGSVGRPLVHYLKERGAEKIMEVNSEVTDPARTILAGEVVISCVGEAGLITKEMINKQAIVVDVGAPKGDMTDEVYEKARVAVGVPGGVGPVTVAMLMQNAVEMVG